MLGRKTKTIVVTSISYVETTEDKLNGEFSKEIVGDKIFINNRGENVCIGLSRELQDIIGLSFVAYESLELMNGSLMMANQKLCKTIEIIRDTLTKNSEINKEALTQIKELIK